MSPRRIWLAFADGEEGAAAELEGPLRESGYEVLHRSNVRVGESVILSVNAALQQQVPVVLCATRAALGDQECASVVNAARTGASPVLVVKMHSKALLSGVGIDHRVADYAADPPKAIGDLLQGLSAHFEAETDPDEAYLDVDGREVLARLAPGLEVDEGALESFVRGLRPGFASPSATPFETLRQLGLARGGTLTLAGALVVGRFPQSIMPMAAIHCFRYLGLSMAAPTTEPTIALGTAGEQINTAIDFVRRNTKAVEPSTSDRAQSQTQSEYPFQIVREIVANAVAHRDYSLHGRRAHVNIFDDRLEIISPGTWVGSDLERQTPMTVDLLATGSDSRNPLLSQALTGLRFLEGQGSGLVKAAEAATRARARLPEVRVVNGDVTVTIYPDVRLSRVAQALRTRGDLEGRQIELPLGPRGAPFDAVFVEPRLTRRIGESGGLALGVTEMLKESNRFKVIAGGPGSGKSTLATYLVQRLSRGDSVGVGLRAIRVADSDGLVSAMADAIGDGLSEPPRPHEIHSVLQGLEVTIVVDGLDEVRSPDQLQTMLNDFDASLVKYPRLRIIAMTRSTFEPFRSVDYWIAPPDMAQAREIVDRLLRVSGGSDGRPPVGEQLSTLGYSSPLELASMAQLVGLEGRIPSSRLDMIESIVAALDTRDRRRSTTLGSFRLDGVFIVLARAWLDEGYPSSWEIGERALRRKVADALNISDASARRVTTTLAEVERSSVLREVRVNDSGESVYAFAHRTFLEYFAAREIVRMSVSDEAVELIGSFADRGEREIVTLVFELVERSTPRGAIILGRRLVDHALATTTQGQELVESILREGAVAGLWERT